MERNEAIEVIKRNYPHVTESGSQFETALRLLIPELKESEGEKIWIINYLSSRILNSTIIAEKENLKKAIAWLEKQGEQKPVEPSIPEIVDEHFHEMIDNEQKPVEWTQKDIDMIDWLIRCCEKEHEELCNDRYGHQDIVSDLKRDCRKKWDWLESLRNRVVSQMTNDKN